MKYSPQKLRSNHRRCSVRKGFLRNSAKFTGKQERLWDRCFPVNFVKFLRTPFFNKTSLVAATEAYTYSAITRRTMYTCAKLYKDLEKLSLYQSCLIAKFLKQY